MNLARNEILAIALRLVLGLPVLLWLGWLWGEDYARMFLPLYREVLSAALYGFHFADLEISRTTTEFVIKASYTIERVLIVGPNMVPPGLDGYVHAPVYYTVTHPIMLAAAALAWPRLTWRGRIARLLWSLPILVVLEAMDIPLVMLSSINDALAQTYDPAGYLVSKPIDWVRFLEGGARSAICITAAFLAAWLHGLFPFRRTKTS
ncbi:MAG: hypothetical protein B7Y41_15645 [Hydrogenophilales bacterium 28-61-23]|nr:MAG: hypothetical protein B7Y41_15645 [Hydrogenophilales bacterium 28-61-23]